MSSKPSLPVIDDPNRFMNLAPANGMIGVLGLGGLVLCVSMLATSHGSDDLGLILIPIMFLGLGIPSIIMATVNAVALVRWKQAHITRPLTAGSKGGLVLLIT